MYSFTGDKQKALSDLKRVIELDPTYKEEAKTEENFKTLRSDPEFKKLVE